MRRAATILALFLAESVGLSASGTYPISGASIGGSISGGTPGAVLFVDPSGHLGQDAANFSWNSVSHKLTWSGMVDMLTFPIYTSTVNQPISIEPNGNGALVVESTTSTHGNARGIGAVDLQVQKDNAADVAGGKWSGVLSGFDNQATAQGAVTVGGENNSVAGQDSAILGGHNNAIPLPITSTIAGGQFNSINHGNFGFIGGGSANNIGGTVAGQGLFSAIVGGVANFAYGTASFVGGGSNNNAGPTQWLGLFSDQSAVVAGSVNSVKGVSAFIGAGDNNSLASGRSVIAGGQFNSIGTTNTEIFIGGGVDNMASGSRSFVGAGQNNSATGSTSAIMGGSNNVVTAGNGVAAANTNWVTNNNSIAVGGANYLTNQNAAAFGRGAFSATTFDLVMGNSPFGVSGTFAPNATPDAVYFRAAGDTQNVHIGHVTDQPSADVAQSVSSLTQGTPAVITVPAAPATGSTVFLSGGTLPASVVQNVNITIQGGGNNPSTALCTLITDQYSFTLSAPASITAGTTYTNNGATFTVVTTTSSSTTLIATASRSPTSSGTLTFVSGSPSGDLTFTASVPIYPYTFTLSAPASITAGTTYTSGGDTFTVTTTTSSSTILATTTTNPPSGPSSSGTLTFVSGSPSGNLSYNSFTIGSTAGGTPLQNGTQIFFSTLVNSSVANRQVPPGLAPATRYYVVNANPGAFTFNVAATPGGTPLTVGAPSDLSRIGAGNAYPTVTASGLVSNQPYFALNTGATTFELTYVFGDTHPIPTYSAGTGAITATTKTYANASAQNQLVLHTTNATHQSQAVSLSAPSSLTSSWNMVFPTTSGSTNQLLRTDGSGNTSWAGLAVGTDGHVITSGSLPSITSGCGIGSSIAGNDNAGRITVGAGVGITGCTLTFASPWGTAPSCQVSDETTPTLFSAAATTTTLTITASSLAASDLITYHCAGF